jgi:hypothetical protein
MTHAEAYYTLKRFQQWQRDDTGEVTHDFTSKQLGEALDMAIEALADERDEFITPLEQWLEKVPASTRLYNILLDQLESEKAVTRVEDLTWHRFRWLRNAGIKSWQEFERLRAEYPQSDSASCPSCGSDRVLEWKDGYQCRLCLSPFNSDKK